MLRLTSLIGKADYAWVGCTGRNDGSNNIVYTWDTGGGACDASLFASHVYTTTSSHVEMYVYAHDGKLQTVATAGVALGVGCEGNHPPPGSPPAPPPAPPAAPPPPPPLPSKPPPPPLQPNSRAYEVCFPTEEVDTTGYSQYGDGEIYQHFADAANVCWNAGTECHAIVRFQDFYLLRSSAGSKTRFDGVSLWERGTCGL